VAKTEASEGMWQMMFIEKAEPIGQGAGELE
jgi:hypothetical protein